MRALSSAMRSAAACNSKWSQRIFAHARKTSAPHVQDVQDLQRLTSYCMRRMATGWAALQQLRRRHAALATGERGRARSGSGMLYSALQHVYMRRTASTRTPGAASSEASPLCSAPRERRGATSSYGGGRCHHRRSYPGSAEAPLPDAVPLLGSVSVPETCPWWLVSGGVSGVLGHLGCGR